jgi:hypothetical protein
LAHARIFARNEARFDWNLKGFDLARRPPPEERSGLHHAIAICMAMALFFFLLWLGMTVIGDSALNSVLIAFTLTAIFVFSLYWSPRSRR